MRGFAWPFAANGMLKMVAASNRLTTSTILPVQWNVRFTSRFLRKFETRTQGDALPWACPLGRTSASVPSRARARALKA